MGKERDWGVRLPRWLTRGADKESSSEEGMDTEQIEMIKAASSRSRRHRRMPKKGTSVLRALYPMSFYQRELTFRRTKTVRKREAGWCKVRRRLMCGWDDVFVMAVGNELQCHKTDPRRVTSTEMPPPVPLFKIKLVAASLKMNGRTRFTLKEANGPTFVFKTNTEHEAIEWMYKFQHTPGLYRCVEDFYKVGKVLGEGATCRVHQCISKCTGKTVALKFRADPNDESGRQGMYNELRILQILANSPHPAIPVLVDYFFDGKGDIKLVEELMAGGELLEKISTKAYFSESEARKYFKAIADGVHHLHKNGIAHRDIKPSNIMLLDNSDDANVKIVDYDLAKEDYSPQWVGQLPCGTTDYMAPEIVNEQKYTQAIDLWSLGCVLYIMLCGDVPFAGKNMQETRERIAEGKVEFSSAVWDQVSDRAKSMVKGLLEMDPEKRLTAEQALQHPWMIEQQLPSTKLETRKSLKLTMSSSDLVTLFDEVHRAEVLGNDPQKSCPMLPRPRKRPTWRNVWDLKSRLSKLTISLIGLEAVDETQPFVTSCRVKRLVRSGSQDVDQVPQEEEKTIRPAISLPNLAGLSEEDIRLLEGEDVWQPGKEAAGEEC